MVRFVTAFALTFVLACSGESGQKSPLHDVLGDVSADLLVSDRTAEPDAPDATGPDTTADAGPLPVPGAVILEDESGFSVTIGTAPLSIVARQDDEVVWNGADLPLRFGIVAEYDPERRYDPELVLPEVEWLALETVVAYAIDGKSHRLTFAPEPDREVTLVVTPGGEGIVTFELAPVAWRNEVLTQVEYLANDDDENFYGLGEAFDHVARRGLSRAMHLSLDLTQESGYNEAHYPIPLLISTRGGGIFVEDRHPGWFDVCDTDPDRVQVRFSAGALRFHLLGATRPLDVLRRYVALAGQPALPPQWAFGVIQWEDEVDGQAQVMENAQAMRDLDLPCSGMWIDRPFATAHESFVFRPEDYPDAPQMVKDLNAMGYRLAIWSVPYLSEDLAEEYAIAEENGYFVVSSDINFTKFGRLMDLTNPGAVELWQGLIKNATDIGIEGFKLDYAEDVISGYSTMKMHFEFFNGEGAETMHHWYQYFYHKAYRDMLPGDAFLINRAGCYGDQTITSVVWPGDLCNDFHFHQEEGHVGGLPAAMVGNQTLSASGYPFFGSDTGGYRHFRPEKEVLVRWVQHTALSPVLQFGGAGANCNPWDFTLYEGEDDGVAYSSQFDEETLDIWGLFARLHIRLFPYVYTYAVRAHETGLPITRPFGLVEPDFGVHPDFEYFYGDDLLVAPIYRAATSREVHIPAGGWTDWFTGTRYEGPQTLTVEVPLDRTVLLARDGALIPMLREGVDTLAPATAEGVDSYANDHGPLVVRAYPGSAASAFTSVLGPVLEMAPEEDGIRIAFDAVEPHFTGLRFEVRLDHVGSLWGGVTVAEGGALLVQVEEEEALATCTGCYRVAEEGQWLQIVPKDLSGTIDVAPGQ